MKFFSYMIEQKQSKTQKKKVINLNKETPKQFLDPTPNLKSSPLGPKKSKMTPKLSQNQLSELKETKKIKIVQLHEQTQEQLSNPTPSSNIVHQGPKNSKMTPKLSQSQRSELKETQKMKVVELHSRPQNSWRTLPNPQKQPSRAPKSQK